MSEVRDLLHICWNKDELAILKTGAQCFGAVNNKGNIFRYSFSERKQVRSDGVFKA